MNARLRRPAVALLTTTLAASVLGIAPAATAVPLGSISGHISAGGAELTDDVYVAVFNLDGDETFGEEAHPDENGDYLVTGIEPGSYNVTFQSPEGTYVYEAYDDATQFEDADPVVVGTEPTIGIDADLAVAGQIAGTVTDESGDPLAEAIVGVYTEVNLPGGGTDWDYIGGAETDISGTYLVDRLPAGSFRVDFDADGYQSEYYDDVPTLEGSEPVDVVAGEETPEIDAALAEDATISGTVTDAAGDPLVDTYVSLSVGDEYEYEDVTRTDADGNYTLDGVAAGSYVVSFDHEDEVADEYLSEYYDNAGEIEDADLVTVMAGDDEVGIDAQLVAGEHEPVQQPTVANLTAPTISGTPQVGSPLTSSAGTWSPNPTLVEYYFVAGEQLLQGGTSPSYVPTAADLGKTVEVYVYASADGYEYGYSYAVSSGPVVAAAPPAPTPTPIPTPSPVPVVDVPAGLAAIVADLDIKGKPKVGSTVKVSGLDLLLRTTVSYKFKWFAGAKAIKKATKSKLKITKAMKGKKISVKVTATAASTSTSVKLKVGKVK